MKGKREEVMVEEMTMQNRTNLLTAVFSMNNVEYHTDAETLDVLRAIVPRAKETGDFSAVAAVMSLGLKTGQIMEAGNVSDTRA